MKGRINRFLKFVGSFFSDDAEDTLERFIKYSVLHQPPSTFDDIRESSRAFSLKRSQFKKAVKRRSDDIPQGWYELGAYCTSREFNMQALYQNLLKSGWFDTKKVAHAYEVIHCYQKHGWCPPTELFFYRDGTAVFWNTSIPTTELILDSLKPFQIEPYAESIVQREAVYIRYTYKDNIKYTAWKDGGVFHLKGDDFWEKYALSSAIASSVLLGIIESNIEAYTASIQNVTLRLMYGQPVSINFNKLSKQLTGFMRFLRHFEEVQYEVDEIRTFYEKADRLHELFQRCLSGEQ